MKIPKIKFEITDSQLKAAAKDALQYTLINLFAQFELKYNMCIEAIEIRHGFVNITMHETASGIRTDEEVAQALREAACKQLNSITQQLANNNHK